MLLSLSLLVASVAAAVLGDENNVANSSYPLTYIVEFDSSAHLNSTIQTRDGPHRQLYSHLDARGVTYEVQGEFREKGLFVGATLQVSFSDVKKIAAAQGVVGVYPVQYYESPAPVPPVEIPLPNLSSRALGEYSKYSVLPSMQVDRVHAQGITGAGVKVAILDSGVDFNLAALGGGFGPGFKVAGGYDFVGPAYGTGGQPQPGDVPYDNCNGHGTLVAGLIAGNDNEYHSPGVAPDASIYAYRIFGCTGSTPDNLVIDAMLRAVRDGCDVINLSLGSATGWSTSAASVVAGRIAATGVQTVVSAGNNGIHGAFYPSSPAAGRDVLSVGAVQTAGTPIMGATVNYNDPMYFTYSSHKPLLSGTYPFYATSSLVCGTESLGDAPADLGGYVVLVQRGGCDFGTKARILQDRGAVAVIIYNTDPGTFSSGALSLPSTGISRYDGQNLVTKYQTGATINLGISPDISPNGDAGRMTYFSSIGPTFDLNGSPHLSAPGQNIFGPIPAAMGNWTVMSGTSFSAPLAAGAAALWISAKGRQTTSSFLRNALQSTAMPVAYTNDAPESVAYSGAGLVQVYDAINADTTISRSEMFLNDTQYHAGSRYVVVKNIGTQPRQYTLSHIPANTIYALEGDGTYMANNPQHDSSVVATTSFSMSAFTLQPDQSLSVLVTVFAPRIDPTRLPIYSGFIQINGGNVPLRVSYQGVAARMKDVPVFEGSSRYYGFHTPALVAGTGTDRSLVDQKYTFRDTDHPSVLWRLLMGTAYLSVDLIGADQQLTFGANYPEKRAFWEGGFSTVELPQSRDYLPIINDTNVLEVVQSSGVQSSGESFTLSRRETDRERICRVTGRKTATCQRILAPPINTYLAVPIAGNIYSSKLWTRSNNNASGNKDNKGASYFLRVANPTFSNGQPIPNGRYRFLMRALKINGDRIKQADYDSWVSPAFEINR